MLFLLAMVVEANQSLLTIAALLIFSGSQGWVVGAILLVRVVSFFWNVFPLIVLVALDAVLFFGVPAHRKE